MKDFIFFLKLVITHYFNGVMGWVLNFIGLLSLFVSMKFPILPIWFGVIILLINAFIAAFLAWKAESRRAEVLENRLAKIKNSIPKYTVNVGDVKKYSIQSMIDEMDNKVSVLENKIEEVKKPVEIVTDDPSIAGLDLVSSFQILKQFHSW